MICLSGILAKKLKEKNLLPEKFEDLAMNPIIPNWYNTLYREDGELCLDSVLVRKDSYNGYYLFAPPSEEMPIDLSAKSWVFEMNANVIERNSDPQLSQLNVNLLNESEYITQLKVMDDKIYFWLYSEASSLANSAASSVGSNWLRYVYDAEAKTLAAYYSFDGDTWTKLGSRAYKQVTRIRIGQSHITGNIPVDSIKFVYDGKVLFGS